MIGDLALFAFAFFVANVITQVALMLLVDWIRSKRQK